MKALWNLVSGIPSPVIFLDAPKLDSVGFRWAPASFFGVNESSTFGKLSVERQKNPTKLTREGPRIKHDGFIFPAGLGDIISGHKISQFEFHDGEGNIYWLQFISKMLKQLLGEAFQRTIEDKSRTYKLTLDNLQVDLFKRQVVLIV